MSYSLPEYPPEWDEPEEDEEINELDFDEDVHNDDIEDWEIEERIERAEHEYERMIYKE